MLIKLRSGPSDKMLANIEKLVSKPGNIQIFSDEKIRSKKPSITEEDKVPLINTLKKPFIEVYKYSPELYDKVSGRFSMHHYNLDNEMGGTKPIEGYLFFHLHFNVMGPPGEVSTFKEITKNFLKMKGVSLEFDIRRLDKELEEAKKTHKELADAISTIKDSISKRSGSKIGVYNFRIHIHSHPLADHKKLIQLIAQYVELVKNHSVR